MRVPHRHTTTPARRTSWWNHIPHSTTPAQRAIERDHTAAPRAECTGGHHEHSAQRAVVPPQHNEHRHNGDRHNGQSGWCRTTSSEKPADHIAPAAQRDAVQPRAVWIGTTLGTKSHPKIAPISGRNARRLERRVGRHSALAQSLPACQNHTCTEPHGTTSHCPEPGATQNHTSITDSRKRSQHRTTSSLYGRAQRAASTTGARTTPA
jgi:hypothetical protein